MVKIILQDVPTSPLAPGQPYPAVSYLSCTGMGIDGDLTGASSMAVDCCAHFFPGDEGLYLLLGGDKLPTLGSLQ